ncbi:MAG: hypothetical protein RLZZ248_468 [Bacteroidota bacterium]
MTLLEKLFTVLGLITCLSISAQRPIQKTGGEIYAELEKLGFLGTAMYLAAHPDDENTRLIAYLANEVKAQTVYLSLTRGDGGQNLIGTEMRELLGLIRTRELLEARKIDGGHQLFTRANDFGYSKHPDETLAIWNEQAVRADVIKAIRKWQPDIIVNRFDHKSAGTTHGHHTTSAILSYESFDQAADPSIFPEQLEELETWQPKRLFFNTSFWFYGGMEAFKKADKSDMVSIDVGSYYPHKGLSNTEIAAQSRSMHKSQGFGATPTRGSEMEYLDILKGSKPSNGDLFEGINTTWSRIEGGQEIQPLYDQIIKDFNPNQPNQSVPQLVDLYQKLAMLPNGHWKTIKMEATQSLIKDCMGLYLEANSNIPTAVPGQEIQITLEATNRSAERAVLQKLTLHPNGPTLDLNWDLENNKAQISSFDFTLPQDIAYTTPYWLTLPAEKGFYRVTEEEKIGLPENPLEEFATASIEIEGTLLQYEIPITFKETDPVKGEYHTPFRIIPKVITKTANPVYLFSDEQPQMVEIIVEAGNAPVSGVLQLKTEEGWSVNPEQYPFELSLKGSTQTFTFEVSPPASPSYASITPVAIVEGKSYQQEMITINYPHIPLQTVLKDASSTVIKLDLQKRGDKIGYLMGAGDEVPNALRQVGFQVDLLSEKEINLDMLKNYDAVVIGIRAYNTSDEIKYIQKDLLEYVSEGGNLIIQYNTSRGLKIQADELAPYPLRLSRDRVTVEESEVKFIAPDHPVLHYPNKITQADFDGWVQERGLYFPDEWSNEFTPILEMADPGETGLKGSLLIAPYGKGNYVYTGLSFFRELPAAVPGAYRLFANLIALGK